MIFDWMHFQAINFYRKCVQFVAFLSSLRHAKKRSSNKGFEFLNSSHSIGNFQRKKITKPNEKAFATSNIVIAVARKIKKKN